MKKLPNGHDIPIISDGTKQKVMCGAAVLLSADVMKHGIALVHPDLPLFTLHFELEAETGVLKHTFELVKPKSPLVKDYKIEIIRTEQ